MHAKKLVMSNQVKKRYIDLIVSTGGRQISKRNNGGSKACRTCEYVDWFESYE
jgi:hypothetical protein